MEKAISVLVKELQEFVSDPATIVQSLMRRLGLSWEAGEAAMEKVQQFWES